MLQCTYGKQTKNNSRYRYVSSQHGCKRMHALAPPSRQHSVLVCNTIYTKQFTEAIDKVCALDVDEYPRHLSFFSFPLNSTAPVLLVLSSLNVSLAARTQLADMADRSCWTHEVLQQPVYQMGEATKYIGTAQQGTAKRCWYCGRPGQFKTLGEFCCTVDPIPQMLLMGPWFVVPIMLLVPSQPISRFSNAHPCAASSSKHFSPLQSTREARRTIVNRDFSHNST